MDFVHLLCNAVSQIINGISNGITPARDVHYTRSKYYLLLSCYLLQTDMMFDMTKNQIM